MQAAAQSLTPLEASTLVTVLSVDSMHLMVYVLSTVCSCFNPSHGSYWGLICVTAAQ